MEYACTHSVSYGYGGEEVVVVVKWVGWMLVVGKNPKSLCICLHRGVWYGIELD